MDLFVLKDGTRLKQFAHYSRVERKHLLVLVQGVVLSIQLWQSSLATVHSCVVNVNCCACNVPYVLRPMIRGHVCLWYSVTVSSVSTFLMLSHWAELSCGFSIWGILSGPGLNWAPIIFLVSQIWVLLILCFISELICYRLIFLTLCLWPIF